MKKTPVINVGGEDYGFLDAEEREIISKNVFDGITDSQAAGTKYGFFQFVAGQTYVLENKTSGAINAYTYSAASSSGEEIDTIGVNISAGNSVTFTASANAPAYKLYRANTGDVIIANTGVGITKIEKEISDIQDQVNATNDNITENIFDALIETSPNGTNYFDFKFKENNKYVFTNKTSGAVNAYTKSAPSGSGTRIDTIGTGIRPGASITFTATDDANALEVYLSVAGEISVGNIDVGILKIENEISKPIPLDKVINKKEYIFDEELSEDNISSFAGGDWSVSDGVVSYSRAAGSGADGFIVDVHGSIESGSKVKLSCNVLECTNAISMYLYSFTNGTRKFDLITRIWDAGAFECEIDLAYYSVYSEVDVNDYSIMFANTSGLGAVSFQMKDLELFTTNSTYFDGDEKLTKILDGLHTSVVSLKNEVDVVSDKTLVSPNGTRYILSMTNNGTPIGINVIPDKHVMIGNSLLLGFGTYGMAASDNTKDYAAGFYNYIHDLNSDYAQTKIYGSNWERAASLADSKNITDTDIIPNIPEGTDLITIELGDNVNTAERENAFINGGCLYLLQRLREEFPAARIVWFGCWYNPSLMDYVVTFAKQTGCEFVSISDIRSMNESEAYIGKVYYSGSHTEEYTVNSYTDDQTNHILTLNITINNWQYLVYLPYSSYTVISATSLSVTSDYSFIQDAGVASHPGDKGFARIANRVLFKLGISPDENAIPIPANR